jgi:hypothetical protein
MPDAGQNRTSGSTFRSLARKALAGAMGGIGGAAFGASAGPPGMVAGTVIGMIIGALGGVALGMEAAEKARRERLLDEVIAGVGETRGAEGETEFEAGSESEVETTGGGLSAGRALPCSRLRGAREAPERTVPRSVRQAICPVTTSLGTSGSRRTLGKYGGVACDRAGLERALAEALDALRAALAKAFRTAPAGTSAAASRPPTSPWPRCSRSCSPRLPACASAL